jgi:hypothetical protein
MSRPGSPTATRAAAGAVGLRDSVAVMRKNVADTVILNVGGTPLMTTKATLARDPQSLFSALLEKDWPRNSDGHILVDRDLRIFSLVISWLRSGQLPQGSELECLKDLLIAEARTWKLWSLYSVLVGGELDQSLLDTILRCSQTPGGIGLQISNTQLGPDVCIHRKYLGKCNSIKARGARLQVHEH